MIRTLTLTGLLLTLLLPPARAQDVSAFLDFMDRFHVFEAGEFRQLEPLPPMAYATGGNFLAYAAPNMDIKVHRNAKTILLERTPSILPTVTLNNVGYLLAGLLKCWDPVYGQKLLCYNTGDHIVEDSLIAFYDNVMQKLNVYYRGRTMLLEDALAIFPVETWKSGDNVLAYTTNFERKFKVFYQGEIYELVNMVNEQLDYKAAQDVVAYQDPIDKVFKAFYRGYIHELEPIMPQSYQVGMGMVAYIDQTNALKVFQGGRVYTAFDFIPQYWEVVDSMVVIRDQTFMRVFHDGRMDLVEQFWPDRWMVSWNMLCYVDPVGNLKAWTRGRGQTIFRNEPIREFKLDKGLVQVKTTVNQVYVWWRNRLYRH
ncbi:MAG: hypothetical protein JNM31_15825 [Flavobacteriales bacterium]|nr:hypothetical protein [Flavobacteriales bacterium]